MIEKDLDFVVNTIARGFTDRGNSNSHRRKYVRHVVSANVIFLRLSKAKRRGPETNIIFSNSYAIRVYPYDNDHMIITVQHVN